MQLTGKKGDVILIHPLMVSAIVLNNMFMPISMDVQPHSASKNHKRIPRFITNPPITLKEPFKLHRECKEDYVRVLF